MKKILLCTAFLALLPSHLLTLSCWAQKDSANQLNVDLQFLTHGEACGGGLPRSEDKKETVEDKSQFLFSRTRLILDYQRPHLQAHAIIQNKSVWGNQNNQSLNL